MSKTFSTDGAMASNPQTLDAMLEEDLPVIVAQIETPVAVAHPVVQAVPEAAPTALPYVLNPSAPPAEYPAPTQGW